MKPSGKANSGFLGILPKLDMILPNDGKSPRPIRKKGHYTLGKLIKFSMSHFLPVFLSSLAETALVNQNWQLTRFHHHL